MTSLSFPNVNVLLALASNEHVHSNAALTWWNEETGRIAFTRITQLSLLRLLTTAATMSGMPLTTDQAWETYRRFFDDYRVEFMPEPEGVEFEFQKCSKGNTPSPKLWQDSWLLAFATAADGIILTFDRGLAKRSSRCRLLAE